MIVKLLFPFLLITGVILGIGLYLSPDNLRGCAAGPTGSGCDPADAIVAVSGGDTAARAKEAIMLYQNGWAPKLIFSGAAQDQTGPSNAATMKRMALRAGVPDEAIYIEESGRTTGQNAEKTKELLGDGTLSSIIVVTSAYHQRRAGLEFERAFGGAQVRNHPASQDKQWSKWWWTTPRGWYLAIGELAKISVFYIEGIGAGGTR